MELTNWIPILIFPIIKYIRNFCEGNQEKREKKDLISLQKRKNRYLKNLYIAKKHLNVY